MNTNSVVSVKTHIWIERNGPSLFYLIAGVALGVLATATLTHFKIGYLRRLKEIDINISKWGILGGSVALAGTCIVASLIYRFIILGSSENRDIHLCLQRMKKYKQEVEKELKKHKQQLLEEKRKYEEAFLESQKDLSKKLLEGKLDLVQAKAENKDRINIMVLLGKQEEGVAVKDQGEQQSEKRQNEWNRFCLQELVMSHQVRQLYVGEKEALEQDCIEIKRLVFGLINEASNADSLEGLANIELAILCVLENNGLNSEESSQKANQQYSVQCNLD